LPSDFIILNRNSEVQLLLLIFSIVLLSLGPVMQSDAQVAQSSSVEAKVLGSLTLVQNAQASGGNVSSLVAQLNQAAQLVLDSRQTRNSTRAGVDLARAASIADNVSALAPGVRAEGIVNTRNDLIATGVELVMLGASCVLVYIYLPRIFWRMWTRAHRNWRIEPA